MDATCKLANKLITISVNFCKLIELLTIFYIEELPTTFVSIKEISLQKLKKIVFQLFLTFSIFSLRVFFKQIIHLQIYFCMYIVNKAS